MPVAPTEAELVTQFQDLMRIRKNLRSALSTYAANQATLVADLESERADAILAGQREMRKSLAVAWNQSADVVAHIYDWVQLADGPLDIPLDEAIDWMFYYWRAIASPVLTILARDFSFGSVSYGTNTGTGTIERNNYDAFAKKLETAIGADSYKARIVEDVTTGAERGNEVWLVESGDASVDGIEQLGAGISTRQTVWHSDDSILSNAGFDNWDNVSTPSSLIDWTATPALAGTGADVTTSTTTFLPAKNAIEARYAAKILATVTFSQRLDKFRTFLEQGVPLYGQIAYNRSAGSATGTLKTTCGSKDSSTITLGSAGSGYQLLKFFVNPEDAYFKNNVADPYTFSVVITISGGYLLLDDIILRPMINIGGLWYAFPAGATAFRAGRAQDNSGDTANWSDTCAETGTICREWIRLTGRQPPTVTSSPAIADV